MHGDSRAPRSLAAPARHRAHRPDRASRHTTGRAGLDASLPVRRLRARLRRGAAGRLIPSPARRTARGHQESQRRDRRACRHPPSKHRVMMPHGERGRPLPHPIMTRAGGGGTRSPGGIARRSVPNGAPTAPIASPIAPRARNGVPGSRHESPNTAPAGPIVRPPIPTTAPGIPIGAPVVPSVRPSIPTARPRVLTAAPCVPNAARNVPTSVPDALSGAPDAPTTRDEGPA